MLGVIALVFGGFALLIAHSYRASRTRTAQGRPFSPEGKLRWPG